MIEQSMVGFRENEETVPVVTQEHIPRQSEVRHYIIIIILIIRYLDAKTVAPVKKHNAMNL
jgi:hypothetical protein